MRSRPAPSPDPTLIWMLLWLGSAWGAGEALVGGLLHFVLPPTYAGRVMLLVAGSLCTFGVRATGRPWAPLVMAAIAAPLKLLSAAIYGLPVVVPMVMTPFFSILSQGAAFAVLASWLLPHSARAGASPLRGAWGSAAWAGGAAPSRARFLLYGALAGIAQAPLFMALAIGASQGLYPSPSVIESLGMVYPAWTLAPVGWLAFLGAQLPVAVLFGAAAACLASWIPSGGLRRWRPLSLAAGAAVCLAISLLTTWRV